MVLRVLTAICVAVSAVVHLYLWQDGMKSVDVVGPAFLLNGVGGLVIAVLVIVWRHWLPLLGAVGFGVATLTAFLISTTPSGFFGVHEQWVGVPVWLSAISEVGAIVLGVAALVVERRQRGQSSGSCSPSRMSRPARAFVSNGSVCHSALSVSTSSIGVAGRPEGVHLVLLRAERDPARVPRGACRRPGAAARRAPSSRWCPCATAPRAR